MVDKGEIWNPKMGGYALAKHISTMQTIKSNIGAVKGNPYAGLYSIVGVQYDGKSEPTDIMSKDDTPIETDSTYKSYKGNSPGFYLREFTKALKPNEADTLEEKLVGMMKLKEVAIGIQPKESLQLIAENNRRTVDVLCLSCRCDSEGMLRCNIVLDEGEESSKKKKVLKITEYGITYISQSLRGWLVNDSAMACLRMDEHGYMKPLEIEQKGMKIGVDGTYVYLTESDGTLRVMGKVYPEGIKWAVKPHEGPAMKFLRTHENAVVANSRLMAPYMFAEQTRILV